MYLYAFPLLPLLRSENYEKPPPQGPLTLCNIGNCPNCNHRVPLSFSFGFLGFSLQVLAYSSKILAFVLGVRSEVMSRKHKAGTALRTSSGMEALIAVSFLGFSSEVMVFSSAVFGFSSAVLGFRSGQRQPFGHRARWEL